MKRQKGFTLIELVIVIVILSLLAVMAVARYMDAISDARKGLVDAIEGALESAVLLVQMKARLEGDTAAGTVAVQKGKGGTASPTTTSQLIPTGDAAGIGAALEFSTTGASEKVEITYSTPAGGLNANYKVGGIATCDVDYLSTTATGVVTITKDKTGC
ncbi:MAG: type II secretion system protein [Gammaproteobacteria bacterium]|nr:type II secretion system protein [Gammaproteobacteria bacterium]